MKPTRNFLLLSALIILSAIFFDSGLLSSAFAQNEETEAPHARLRDRIKSLALIPFTSKASLSESMPEETVEEKERYLTINLYEALTAELMRIEIIPLQKSESEFLSTKADNPKLSYREQAVAAGKSLGVDAVMTGAISEYTEREGSAIGVESPAAVTFSVEVLDTRDGRVLWESYFKETQKPLLENVYEIGKFFKRGAKWITSDELAKEGARETALEFSQYLLEN
ncbi:MAG: hypothetical protein AB1598_09645 [Thermodesulfobacteriota bacterium]